MTPKPTQIEIYPAFLRVRGRDRPLNELLAEAIATGLPFDLASKNHGDTIEDTSAIDATLTTEKTGKAPQPPLPGTSYAGLTPAQRDAFLSWSRKPENPAPGAYQQLYLANLEARLFETEYRQLVIENLQELGGAPAWAKNPAYHRLYLLSCWLLRDGQSLINWVSGQSLMADLLGIAFGFQALMEVPLVASEVGAALAAWKLGERLPSDLLKLRLDSLTAILGRPPLEYVFSKVDLSALAPRLWRTVHRGLHILIPQPDLRPLLEPTLRDLLAVADVNEEEEEAIPTSMPDMEQPSTPKQESKEPSLEELGWRLIL